MKKYTFPNKAQDEIFTLFEGTFYLTKRLMEDGSSRYSVHHECWEAHNYQIEISESVYKKLSSKIII